MCEPLPGEKSLTYSRLWSEHGDFRWFLTSYIITHIGEWLTYVASMTMIEEHSSDDGETNRMMAISLLVVLRLLPSVFVSPLGGILADSCDRRNVMLCLDLLSSTISLLYLISYYMQSIKLLYLATFLQEIISGLYEPARSSIVPLLVPPIFIPRATTAVGMVWSSITAVGSSLSGLIVQYFGIGACFTIDAITYLASAACLVTLRGSYSVHDEHTLLSKSSGHELDDESTAGMAHPVSVDVKSSDHPATENYDHSQHEHAKHYPHISSPHHMIKEALVYIRNSPYGPVIFVKVTGALTFGASDVLAVVFSQDGNSDDSALRLGIYFAAVGVGCILGPTALDRFWQAHGDGQLFAWQYGMALAFWPVAVGYLLLGFCETFWLKCLWNGLRALGVAILWIDSSQILQQTTPKHLLGRIMALDLALAPLGESFSAVLAGILLDDLEFSGKRVAYLLGIVAVIFALCWSHFSWRRQPSRDSHDGSLPHPGIQNTQGEFVPMISINDMDNQCTTVSLVELVTSS